MTQNKFEIILELKKNLPTNFLITYEEIKDWHYGKYKPNTESGNKFQKVDIRNFNEVNIIFENKKIIAGRFSTKAINQDDSEITIPFDFMIAKDIIEKTKHRIRWKTKWEYYNQLSVKQGMSIHRKIVDQVMPECIEKMKTKHLPWSTITREERYFCSHLYHSILGREKEFVKWLNTNLKPKGKLKLRDTNDWQISYEVCFYRDFLKANGETIKAYNIENDTNYPPKRTFDLCLFSNDEIIIIEAKVQQGFSLKQIEEIDQDERLVKKLVKTFTKTNIEVKTILLYSSRYTPREKSITNYSYITWNDLNDSLFKDKNLFQLADEKFRK